MPSWDRPVFENALLGLLWEGPRHGYEICRHFGAGGEWAAVGALARSQVYALLKSLEERGLARPALRKGARGPARRVYFLTETGRAQFLDWVRRPVSSIRGLRVEFILKLHFLRRLKMAGLRELFTRQESVLFKRLAEVEADRSRAEGLVRSVLDLQEKLLRAGLEWLADQEPPTKEP